MLIVIDYENADLNLVKLMVMMLLNNGHRLIALLLFAEFLHVAGHQHCGVCLLQH